MLGGETLVHAVADLEKGTATRTVQDHAAHTYAPMLDKSLSPMDFTKPARVLHDQVRGLIPWPCANATIHGVTLKVHRAAVGEETTAPAGSVVEANKRGIAVACGDGRVLRLLEVQADGGKRMASAAYLAGHPMECDV